MCQLQWMTTDAKQTTPTKCMQAKSCEKCERMFSLLLVKTIGANYADNIFAISHCIFMQVWEAVSKTRASCFIRGSKHLETIKALRLRRRAFICFSVFGTPDETLALVFDILPQKWPNAITLYWQSSFPAVMAIFLHSFSVSCASQYPLLWSNIKRRN